EICGSAQHGESIQNRASEGSLFLLKSFFFAHRWQPDEMVAKREPIRLCRDSAAIGSSTMPRDPWFAGSRRFAAGKHELSWQRGVARAGECRRRLGKSLSEPVSNVTPLGVA
ncbi:MAG: hypothetical protein ACRD9W_06735, partial [Terriglobia bacterium]